jgi:hypothetical protein
MTGETVGRTKFVPFLLLSFFASFLSAVAPLRIEPNGIALGALLFMLWVGTVVFGIRTFRRKGLWLILVGSPFALLFLFIAWVALFTIH